MIRETPDGREVDPVEHQMGLERRRSGRPWVMANFVTTIDGAAEVDGGSTKISDPDDIAMFGSIRAVADYIVVGAETVRVEDYGPVRLDERRRRVRVEAGMKENPGLVVISESLDLDPGARIFGDPDQLATIITGKDASDRRFAALSGIANVVRLDGTTPADIIAYLNGAEVIVCEGGPTLWGQFVATGLVDEMALTMAPLLVAGSATRIAHGAPADPPLEFKLDRVLYGDRSLFLRYVSASSRRLVPYTDPTT